MTERWRGSGRFRGVPVLNIPGLERLNEREIRVLDMLASDMSVLRIAMRLETTQNSIGNCVFRLREKLNVLTNHGAVAKYLRLKWEYEQRTDTGPVRSVPGGVAGLHKDWPVRT